MTSETQKIKFKLQALTAAFSDLETELEPLFDQSLPETLLGLEPIQQAKIQTALPYVVYDLIFIYLKSRGIDPKTHPVISELDRIKQYFDKISNVENPPKRATEIDKAAASRFITHAISQAQLQKDQVQWKKTAAEEAASDDGSDSDSSNDKDKDEDAAVSTSKVTPKTLSVQPKLTSKILARQQYEKELRELDDGVDHDDDTDVLEVFDENDGKAKVNDEMDIDEPQPSHSKAATTSTSKPKKKDKGKGKQVDFAATSTSESAPSGKRRRSLMDPFAGYGEDSTPSSSKDPSLDLPNKKAKASKDGSSETSPKKKKNKNKRLGS